MMARPAVRDGSDPKAIRDTRVLVDCLQELVRGAYRPVRNCAKYSEVVWFADVPEGLVRRSKDADSRIMVVKHRPPLEAPRLPAVLDGRVSVEATAVAAVEPPELIDGMPTDGDQGEVPADGGEIPKALDMGTAEVLKAYEAWAGRWKRWAQEELAAEPQRRLHQRLYRMAKKIQQDGDTFEVVLAVGLLQLGAERASARVRRHIVSVPVTLTVDPNSVNITVSLVPGQSGRLEDTEFLSESDGYTSELLGVVRSDVADVAFHPLSDRATEALRSWSQRAFGVERTLPFDAGRAHPDLTADPRTRSVHRAPALILREHGQRSVLGFFEGIARALKRPGTQAPLGLAQLLYDLEPEQRMAWRSRSGSVPPALGPEPLFPMVTNGAQLDVLDRLQRDTSVVVQGPPGTGKTHTISNLIAALLADGKRVLVTSEKGQALKVLRDQLPARLRSMCVIQRDHWQGGSSDLRQSLGALAHLSATTNPDRLQQRIEAQQTQRHQLMAEQAKLRERLRAVREVEWYEHPEIAPGYRGRLDEIVQAVEHGTDEYQWLPSLPAQPEQLPPLTTDEAQRLWLLVTMHGPGILDAHIHYCPDPATLPNPTDAAGRISELEAAEEALGPEPVTPLAQTLAEHGDAELTVLETLLDQAQQALQSVGLSADPTSWHEEMWSTRALQDGIARRWQQMWDSIRNASQRAQQTQQEIAAASFPEVEIPQLSEGEEKELLISGRNVEQYVLQGGQLNKRWPRPAVLKQARVLLEQCRVEGMAPDGREQVAAVVRHLEMRAHARTLRGRWAGVGSTVGQDTAELLVSELLDRAAVLQAVDTCVEVIRQVHATLLASGIPASVTTSDQWQDIRHATARARQLLQVRTAGRQLDELFADLPQPQPHAVAELQHAADAAAARDARAYALAVDALAAAYQREADRRETGKLFQRLNEAHPELAQAFAADPLSAHWRARFTALPQAWAWRQAQDFLDTYLLPGREEQLEGELAQVEARLNDLVEQLVCDRAALHCVSRMTTKHKQALAAYASAIANAGQGTTEYGKRHQRHARSAMQTAQGAVPAWIMPLRQVAETISPEPDSFDVVIVDEASQVGLNGLLLLWLAPRIIVVGDDRQCAPSYTGSKHDRITQIFDERMAALEPWQREGFDPKSNLYELLSSRFTEVICLTEHFRCMPEIIKWSSMQFYPDNQLVLLRQHGSDRLPPLKVIHLPEGHCEGRRDKLINRPEAEAVVDQLHRLTQDPAYADRTMGVIILRQGDQTRLVQDLVDQRIDMPARERHNIQIGTPEEFQGDQRDVILLSMVVDGRNVIAATGRHHERRFNVAASRARDQMWLFHSMTADQLSSKDLRHSLLTYMQSPPPPYTHAHQPANVSPDQLCAPFQSLFEQRIFLRIKERGYDVVPQWEVNGKYIDLVVTGDHGRLAVECDGSPYHSTRQQIHDDAERERELRRAGWTFWRVRSSAFALSPEEALAPLWKRLTELGIHPRTTPGTSTEDTEFHASWTPVGLAEAEPEDEDRDPYDGELDDGSEAA
ncbi:AAA domain-containing protein [Streptomyces umbrinus]|uniref:AAA domain-containing protein n=1 Tax=Streptomyces umbrinus TaxID=67370 RepID=UPI00216B4BB1|nr:AAA domain-containing protein [Streptomyces umbrinus]